MSSQEEYSVQIECIVGFRKPSFHFKDMCKTCNIDKTWFELKSNRFSLWTWVVKPEHAEDYKKAKPKIRDYFQTLYKEDDSVRYISW